MVEAPEFSKIPHIRHGFFGREGGSSHGIYASLNCGLGSGDDRKIVVNNRASAASRLNLAAHKLITAYQYHSSEIITVTKPWNHDDAPKADGMVCKLSNIGLGLLTADCAPVLFADENAGVIGAAHAGWRGAISGVTDNIVTAMENLGARRSSIVAVIGPAISQNAYEVGPEFITAFVEQDAGHRQFFVPSSRNKHYMFDLPGYLMQRLQCANLAAVSSLKTCTYAHEKQFFSYRRTTHKGEKDYGRQISIIALN